ncbi:MAG: HD-GYP domain-containing protein [Candidatus Pelagadaptatus aseana]|uniref:HD-GYP domain-containing protein n=1 Tax=Candidatus Pelagadaptatus aseana TaxID=3120508 RepID=UPI0039B1D407
MSVRQVKYEVNNLVVGMYVAGLDRPWTQTPFPLQGFYIRDADDIAQLQRFCSHVYIDVKRKAIPGVSTLKVYSGATGGGSVPGVTDSSAVSSDVRGEPIQVTPLKVVHNSYPLQVDRDKELQKAEQLHRALNQAVASVMHQLQSGESVSLRSTRRVASAMVDSVLRHPDALTWLSRVQMVDEFTYAHSVRCAVWAIIFGRHIGMSKVNLERLALGVLLKDVGKSRLPQELLALFPRSDAQEQEYRRFVSIGVDILQQEEALEPQVVSVVKNHCERLNGSGFPLGLKGSKIPVSARIAGMVTFYDELVFCRSGQQALSPSKAVSRLYDCRNQEFQEDLVVEFIRAIGLYPTGTLVELSTGEVAVVVEQNLERRLKPQVLILLDATKQPLAKPRLLDLAVDDKKKRALIDAGKLASGGQDMIDIAVDLAPGSYGLDAEELRNRYMMKSEKGFLKSLFRRHA